MSDKELAELYSDACLRIHTAVSHLYEDLYDDDDNVKSDVSEVIESIKRFRYWVNTELDLIKEASKEYDHD
jgi:hypothetical protein|tara:strand:+ start:5692 stop:5904 length:213 start_codon:yes stop_codon:yes gene_type:complete